MEFEILKNYVVSKASVNTASKFNRLLLIMGHGSLGMRLCSKIRLLSNNL